MTNDDLPAADAPATEIIARWKNRADLRAEFCNDLAAFEAYVRNQNQITHHRSSAGLIRATGSDQ